MAQPHAARQDRESDLVLFVVIHGLTPEIESAILDAAFEIGLKHDTYLSPRIVGREVLETPLWRNTPFIRTVLSEGVPV